MAMATLMESTMAAHIRFLATWLLLAVILLAIGSRLPADTDTFGQKTQSEAALMGILYDFKQTQDRQPTSVDAESYWKVLDEFFSKGWDETVLNKYYRVSRPLYTTQIFIPQISANEAPKAFGAEATVKPSRWIIHYKGQVSPPEDGTYRFVGSSDDFIAVAVNGKTELIAPLRQLSPASFPLTNWKSTDGFGLPAADGNLVNGDWVTLKAGEPIDLDVIIGERPGGVFNAFLMVEKQGGNYETKDGHPVLPIFQVAPYDTPSGDPGLQPQFSKDSPPWKSYQ
jgi:hypothetical protein